MSNLQLPITIRTYKMNPSRSGAPGVKMLITAASLAATLGGWAVFAYTEARPITSQPQPAVIALASRASVTALNLPPMPTLVPLPDPSAIAAGSQSSAAPAAPPAPTLRVVSAPPPAPVTLTQSSRP
jgi:hypothetical protein